MYYIFTAQPNFAILLPSYKQLPNTNIEESASVCNACRYAATQDIIWRQAASASAIEPFQQHITAEPLPTAERRTDLYQQHELTDLLYNAVTVSRRRRRQRSPVGRPVGRQPRGVAWRWSLTTPGQINGLDSLYSTLLASGRVPLTAAARDCDKHNDVAVTFAPPTTSTVQAPAGI